MQDSTEKPTQIGAGQRDDSGTATERLLLIRRPSAESIEHRETHQRRRSSILAVLQRDIDPVEVKINSHKALLTSIKSLVGSSILAMPFGFRLSGTIAGFMVLLFSVVINYWGGKLVVEAKQHLVRCKRILNNGHLCTIGDLADMCLGRVGRFVGDISMVILQLGTCIAYLIFVRENVQDALQGTSFAAEPAFQFIVFALMITALFCIRRISHLAWLALTADIVLLMGLLLCSGLVIKTGTFSMTERLGMEIDTSNVVDDVDVGIGGPFHFLGIALFAIEGVGLVLPIEGSMQRPQDYPLVWSWSMIIVAALYLAFGLLGYAAFGLATRDIIILNLERSSWKLALQLIYSVALLLTAPLQAMPAFDIIERDWIGLRNCRNSTEIGPTKIMNDDRSIEAVTGIAALIPEFSVVISILGQIFGSILGFGLPSIIYWISFPNASTSMKMLLASLILCCIGAATIGVTSIVLKAK